ncbi:Predicted L-lactate dehydrogenase, Fe-S oxidoreductase subunit YkgE [Helicobacter heilmannii]|uniref:(Fe-S)-binding protein n=1 Tax=Helicobacter heilmannii TaxID=35817 RepID=UPI0006A1CFE4|nr:(Fe-S)-binding protein [Helicobacter heilmannii]CRF48292.1 Predicted L-lactate dehydrogenase, Fe-S oxidoreductase subunit YkgE [Helicobacter heilmannii]
MRVYFFATCLGGAVFSQTALNCIKLLQREGVEVIFKKDQTCCGQPSYNSGYYEQTRQIVLHNVRLFQGDYPVIVPSGSCVGMMAHDYLELFEGHKEHEEVKNFSLRVFELAEFLDKKLEVRYTDLGAPIKVTWHSNCHALRVSKVIESAKKIISQLSNVELVPLQREEECCGFGGTFAVKEPEISNAMVQEKIHDIESRQVEYILSADAGCLLNISGAMAKMRSKTKSMHFYDFLAQRVGLGV